MSVGANAAEPRACVCVIELHQENKGVKTMNDSPHLLAIIESKMAQVRTRLEHHSYQAAIALLAEVQIYADELRGVLK